ncbi:hypothetical protein RB213_015970 [Colletotrichum asianum]
MSCASEQAMMRSGPSVTSLGRCNSHFGLLADVAERQSFACQPVAPHATMSKLPHADDMPRLIEAALCQAQMSLMEQELSKPGNQLPSGTWDYPYTLFESLELPSRLFTVQMPDTNQTVS